MKNYYCNVWSNQCLSQHLLLPPKGGKCREHSMFGCCAHKCCCLVANVARFLIENGKTIKVFEYKVNCSSPSHFVTMYTIKVFECKVNCSSPSHFVTTYLEHHLEEMPAEQGFLEHRVVGTLSRTLARHEREQLEGHVTTR